MGSISVLGIGKLGLGLALLLEKAGYNVLGVDINTEYVNQLNTKTFKTQEPQYMHLLTTSKNFNASCDLNQGLNHSNIIFIMVQTPNSGGTKFYDHSIVSSLLQEINAKKVKNKHIVIGCTLMPKYIDEVGIFLLEDCENTTLSYNPEFVAQGDIINGFLNPDMVLIGTHSVEVGCILQNIYNKIVTNTPAYCVMCPLDAEITKITINGYITTKISFANMISDVCDEVGADKSVVLGAVGSDSRIGTKYFKPGHSFGGPCFPRDTKALAMFIDQNRTNNDLLLATSKYNQLHSEVLAKRLLEQNQDEYVIDQVCYKPGCDIPIIEESPQLKIAKVLSQAGKKVVIKDTLLLINEVKKEHGNIFEYESPT